MARAGDVLGLAVEVDTVLGEGGRTGSGGVGAQVGLGERYGEGGVCGEVELGVAFAPVSGVWPLAGQGMGTAGGWRGTYLMTAMFTGAVVLAM